MRKFLAIFLTVAMLASFAVVPALAANEKVFDVPAPYVDATQYSLTGSPATITTAGTTFTFKKDNTDTPPVSVDTPITEVKLGGTGANIFASGTTATSGRFDFELTTGGDLKVKLNGTNVATDPLLLQVTVGDDTDSTSFYIMAGTYAPGTELNSISIKEPTSTVMVAGDSKKLEIEKDPKDHSEDVFWFVSNTAISSVVGSVSANKGNSATLTADGTITSTTAVTVKAVSASGKISEMMLYVVPGAAATNVTFTKGVYELKANEDATLVAETIITPSNGKTAGRAVNVINGATKTGTVSATDLRDKYEIKQGADVVVEFALDALGGIEVLSSKLNNGATPAVPYVYPFAVILEVEVPTTYTGSNVVNGKVKATTVVSFTKPDAAAAGRGIQIEAKPTSGKLAIGQKFEYKAAVYDKDPNYRDAKLLKDATIEWFSSKPSVATVDKKTGIVTAVAEGTATIYATSAGAKDYATNRTEAAVALTVVKDASKGTVKYVKAGSLSVRALASSSSIKLGELKQGDVVDVLEITGAWAKIGYSGSYAYVAAQYLGDPVNFSVTSSKLAVRSFPGATAALKTLVYGDTVKVIGKYAANPAWTAILLDDTTIAYVASANIAEGTQVGIVTSGTLTMRVGASTTSAAFANKLVKGQTVEILGKEGSFLKVKTAEGFVGYAAASYITIL